METIPLTEKGAENNEPGIHSFLESMAGKFDRVMQIAAFASLMAGGEFSAHAKDSPKHQKQEMGERSKDLAQVNAICSEHGFDFVDAKEGHMDIHLPPGPVKKVILFLGQSHAQGAYSKVDKALRAEVVRSQNDIFTMFKNAFTKTHVPAVSLVEGVCTDDQAATLEGKDEHQKEIEHFALSAASDPHVDIKKTVEQYVLSTKKYVAGSHVYDSESLKNSLLFDGSVCVRRVLQDKEPTSLTARNLDQIALGIEAQMHPEELAYTQGGAAIAARIGFAHIRPAESFDANVNVARIIESKLGFKIKDGEDLYAAIGHLKPTAQKEAYKLIGIYAESKEREMPAMTNAEKEFEKTDLIVLDYGAHHTFTEVLDDQYKSGKMQGVAMVKVDTRNFHFENTAKK